MVKKLPSDTFGATTPLGMAIMHYLLQLHEQYPGILAQLAIDQPTALFDEDNQVRQVDGVPCPYHYSGRLFFSRFEANLSLFKLIPLKRSTLETIADISLTNNEDELMSNMNAFIHAAIEREKQETAQNSADHLISHGLTETKEIIQDLLNLTARIEPIYTEKNIQTVLFYRRKLAEKIFSSQWIHVINGFLAHGYEGHSASEAVQRAAQAKIAGAALFRVLHEAKKNNRPLPPHLTKFITSITNSPHQEAQAIIQEQEAKFRLRLENEFNPTLFEQTLEKSQPALVKDAFKLLRNNLHHTAQTDEFRSFHAYAFQVIFERLTHFRNLVLKHPNYLLTMDNLIAGFIENNLSALAPHLTAIESAKRLLNTIKPSKQHHAAMTQHARLQNKIFERSESNLKQLDEAEKAAAEQLEAKRQEHERALERFQELVKRAAKNNKAEKLSRWEKIGSPHRSSSLFNLNEAKDGSQHDDAELCFSEERSGDISFRQPPSHHRPHLSRQNTIDRLNRLFKRTHATEEAETDTEKATATPPLTRKKKPRSPVATPTPSPTSTRKSAHSPSLPRKRKVRKHDEPPSPVSTLKTGLFASSPAVDPSPMPVIKASHPS